MTLGYGSEGIGFQLAELQAAVTRNINNALDRLNELARTREVSATEFATGLANRYQVR